MKMQSKIDVYKRQLQEATDIKTLGDLTEEEFEAHKSAIKDPVRQLRAKHAVYENQRAIHAVEAVSYTHL